jgi:hypothetical protein
MPEGPLQRLEAELGRLRLVELGWLPEGDGQV